jgi:hypothetical protein
MAIFDQIIGSLTGESSLRRIRDRSIQAGRSAYDPTVLNPQIGVAQQQAVQGIDEGAYRRDVINQLFRPVSSAVYGGNQAAAIAGASAQDMARTRALGTFESQLAQQDIQAKQAGAEQLGKLQSSQLQIQGQRDAYTQQVRSEFEAEKDSRRMELGASVAKFGIEAAGGAGAIGGAIGGAFSDMKAKAGVMNQMFSLTPESIPEVAQLDIRPGSLRSWMWGAGKGSLTRSITPVDALRLGNMPVEEGEMSLSNGLTNPRAIPRFGSANPLPNVSQFGRESLALADAFLNLPQTPVATGATPASQTTPVTATPTFEEFTKMITGAIDPSDRQMNQLSGERVPTLFETLEIDKMIRDTGLPDMVGEGVSFLDRVGKDIMYRANPFIQFRNLQDRRAKEREEQLRELYNQRYNQRSK